ncbi:MAG: cyclic nucleotide-binding domain-containing protein, partial [Planctomycetia bacterium]
MSLLPPGLVSGTAWAVGALVAVTVLWSGVRLLRGLARRRVAWWGSVAGLALVLGPALGLLVAALVHGHPLQWGSEPEHVLASSAWSLLVFFGAWSVLGLVRAFLRSPAVGAALGASPPVLVLDAVRYLLLLGTLFFVLGVVWDRPDLLSTLFTASAVGTVILGFALQETLSNFFAGMALVSERAYSEGDWLVVGDIEGQVVAISRRATHLRTRSGDIVTLSNRSMAGGTLRNLSRPTPLHSESFIVGAPYETPPNRVREVLRGALEDVPGVLHDPAPVVRLKAFSASSVDYEVKVWLEDLQRLNDIRSDAMIQAWYHFQRAGIEFPYPVQEQARFRRGTAATALGPAEVRARLAAAALFKALPEEALDVLARGAHTVDVSAGERIVRQGAPGRSCFVVDTGRVAVSVEEGSTSRTVATLGPGELFGEMSLLTGQDRSATVRASSDARRVEVEAASLRQALALAPGLAATLAQV